MLSAPSVVSLFAGIGGFDLGLTKAGFRVAAHVEQDSNCQKLLRSKFPEALCISDVRDVSSGNTATPDVLCGGWPCQDLSVAGLRAGLAGSRSGLFYEFTRIAYELQPSFVLWENVPGLLNSDQGRDMLRVVREFQRIGYCGGWRTLDAQYLGLAQRRRRVFGVFARRDIGAQCCAEILSLSEGMRGHPAPCREARKRASDPSQGGPAKCLGTFSGGIDREDRHTLICREVAHDGVCHQAKGGDPTTDNYVTHTLRGEGFDASEDGTGRGTPLVATCAPPLTGNPYGDHESRDGLLVAFSSKDSGDDAGPLSPTLRSMNFRDSHMNGGGQVAVFDPTQITSPVNYSNPREGDPSHPLAARGHPPVAYRTAGNCGPFEQGDKTACLNTSSDPCQTIVAFDLRGREGGSQFEGPHDTANIRSASGGSSRSYVAQSAVRRLTPKECERLQGFPDDFTAGFSDSCRYRMLGNAIAVPVAEWIGRRFMRALLALRASGTLAPAS